jgi:hypothetical protein
LHRCGDLTFSYHISQTFHFPTFPHPHRMGTCQSRVRACRQGPRAIAVRHPGVVFCHSGGRGLVAPVPHLTFVQRVIHLLPPLLIRGTGVHGVRVLLGEGKLSFGYAWVSYAGALAFSSTWFKKACQAVSCSRCLEGELRVSGKCDFGDMVA